MFNNSFMSDVKFVPRGCGPDEAIYAHKYMLATSSSVFYEFFYGKLAKRNEFSYDMGTYIYNDEGYIVIEEDFYVETTVFAFLRFLYKEECPKTVAKPGGVIESVGVKEMVKKYKVQSFGPVCVGTDMEVENAEVFNGEWQLGKLRLAERSSHMYNNPLMSNIQLSNRHTFWPKYVYAHKYVLATSSPVFYEMLYGDLKLLYVSNPYIYVGFDEEIITVFLRFLYKEECSENIETVLKVLEMTKKYQVQSFQSVCKHRLVFITPWPAFKVIEKLLEVEAKEMAEPWWTRIESRIDEVIASEYFLNINQRTLTAFLERETLCYPEIDLFHAVLRWSEYQCKLKRFWINKENQRRVLGDSIFRIRFSSMTEGEFQSYVVSSGVLTVDEVQAIVETMRSGADNYNYVWALPPRADRAWYCQYFSVGQLKNMCIAIVLGFLLLVFGAVFMIVYPYVRQIYEQIQEILKKLQESRQQQQYEQRHFRK